MVRTWLRRKNSPLPLFQPKRGRTFEKEVQEKQLQWKNGEDKPAILNIDQYTLSKVMLCLQDLVRAT